MGSGKVNRLGKRAERCRLHLSLTGISRGSEFSQRRGIWEVHEGGLGAVVQICPLADLSLSVMRHDANRQAGRHASVAMSIF